VLFNITFKVTILNVLNCNFIITNVKLKIYLNTQQTSFNRNVVKLFLVYHKSLS